MEMSEVKLVTMPFDDWRQVIACMGAAYKRINDPEMKANQKRVIKSILGQLFGHGSQKQKSLLDQYFS
jgi:hypothetical protein